MNFDYKFSLIIPNRNIPDLLQRCLDSVPNRDDLQIIIVDDNSDPSIVDFSNYPGRDRDNVEIIFTKEGKGAGYARNKGILASRGTWLIFSDSDDTFETDNFNLLLNKYAESTADIVFFGANRIDAKDSKSTNGSWDRFKIMQSDNIIEVEEWFRYRSNEPWAKIIKRSLVEQYSIRFSETISANDVFFSIQTGALASHVVVDKTPIYNWIKRFDGNLSSNWSYSSTMDRFSQTVIRNKFLEKIGKNEWGSNIYIQYYSRFLQLGFSKTEALALLKQNSLSNVQLQHYREWYISYILHCVFYPIRFVFRVLREWIS